jgi:hypothetical protein
MCANKSETKAPHFFLTHLGHLKERPQLEQTRWKACVNDLTLSDKKTTNLAVNAR